jgi:hypothetical protein
MGYRLSWLLENRILIVVYEGVMTKTDLQTYLAEAAVMRDHANNVLGEGGPLVHTITDARRLTKNELSLKEALKTIESLRQQRVGWSIYIPAGKADQFFAVVGHQIAGVRFRCVESVSEGVELLKRMDDTLVDFDYSGDVTLSRNPFTQPK